MTIPKPAATVFSGLCLVITLFSSCYKEPIKFGDIGGESNTRLITIDTITPILSTVILDSFPTSDKGILLIGRWEDPLMGTTRASTYFQVGLPASVINLAFPNDAVYDSLAMTLRPNKQYFGDTVQAQTFSVYELANQPDYTYANSLYNTSSTAKASATPMGSTTVRIRLNRNDSVQITLPYSKGLELYNKIKAQTSEVKSEDNFLNYLRGFCIQVNDNDKGAVFGFNADSSVMMKLYYHTTIPTYQQHVIEFTLTRTAYQYNQLLSNRTGTALDPLGSTQKEFFTSKQYPYAFTQSGTGVMMKMKFPSLRNILGLGSVVRLLNAKVVIKPVEQTFDTYGYRLPDTLYMAQTDGTNNIGSFIPDITGSATQFSTPSIDYIYRLNTNYTFDLSSYTNYLLNTAGVTEDGVFVLEQIPGSNKKLNRALMGSYNHPKYRTQLIMTVMVIE
jgi:hypothetical protein